MNKRRLSQASLLRLPIYGSDFEFAFSQTGKKQNGSDFREKAKRPDFQFAFSRAGKKQNGPGKSKMVQTSNLLFPGPGKSKMYQTCSLESGLETSSACGIRAYDLLLTSLALYPLGHSSLTNMLFSRLYKRKLDAQFAFPAQTFNLLFPGSYDRVVCALTAAEPTTSPHIPALVGML